MVLEPNSLHITLQLLISGAMGWLLGFERSRIRRKPGGARTFALICLGTTLFTVVAMSSFDDPDSGARMVANIITGVGFIGAGVIWKHGAKVISGITTAATVWVSAAIGIAIGLEHYFTAIIAFVFAMFLILIKKSKDNDGEKK